MCSQRAACVTACTGSEDHFPFVLRCHVMCPQAKLAEAQSQAAAAPAPAAPAPAAAASAPATAQLEAEVALKTAEVEALKGAVEASGKLIEHLKEQLAEVDGENDELQVRG